MSFAHSETAEHVMASLGAILRRHREASGRSLGEVAPPAGISPAFLSEVERGRKDISTERLLGVCRALGVALGDLYLELARELGAGEPVGIDFDADPRLELQRAARVLDQDSLRTVAHFGAYLALAQSAPAQPRRPIGFTR